MASAPLPTSINITPAANRMPSVRKALAIDYLTTTPLSTEDVALTLEFSDAVSFRHAFKRWTGLTPNEYRRERSSVPGPKTITSNLPR